MLGRSWDIHALIGGALLTIIGTQVLALGLCAHAYGTYFMGEKDAWFDRDARALPPRARPRARRRRSTVGGFVTALVIVIKWIDHGFGALGLRAARDRRLRAADRRAADLLLVVPDQHHRPAPRSLTARCARGRNPSAAGADRFAARGSPGPRRPRRDALTVRRQSAALAETQACSRRRRAWRSPASTSSVACSQVCVGDELDALARAALAQRPGRRAGARSRRRARTG